MQTARLVTSAWLSLSRAKSCPVSLLSKTEAHPVEHEDLVQGLIQMLLISIPVPGHILPHLQAQDRHSATWAGHNLRTACCCCIRVRSQVAAAQHKTVFWLLHQPALQQQVW